MILPPRVYSKHISCASAHPLAHCNAQRRLCVNPQLNCSVRVRGGDVLSLDSYETFNLETCYCHPRLVLSRVPFWQRGKGRAHHQRSEKRDDAHAPRHGGSCKARPRVARHRRSPRVTQWAEAPLPPTRPKAPLQPNAPRVTTCDEARRGTAAAHTGAPVPAPTPGTDGCGPATRGRPRRRRAAGRRVRPAAAWPHAGRSCGEPGGGGDRSPGCGDPVRARRGGGGGGASPLTSPARARQVGAKAMQWPQDEL